MTRSTTRVLPAAATVASLVLLTGCGGTAVPVGSPVAGTTKPAVSATPTASPTKAATTTRSEAAAAVITIRLANGKVSPNGDRVPLKIGDRFTLDITSDRDDTVHVHGFDVEIPVSAGGHVTKTLTAKQAGRYEVESHHPALVIVVLQVS